MTPSAAFSYRDIAKMIDHSLLAPTLTTADFEAGIRLALEYDVASVCLVPSYLQRCVEALAGSDVKASTTIGFPHGGQATAAKVAESKIALQHGAAELDMVINLYHTLSGDWAYVRAEIAAVLAETHGRGQKLKVIFENCYLTDAHKIRLCEICGELGVDWVKTSTGFGIFGRNAGRSAVDARTLAGRCTSEGLGRRARARLRAGRARNWRDALWLEPHPRNSGRLPAQDFVRLLVIGR